MAERGAAMDEERRMRMMNLGTEAQSPKKNGYHRRSQRKSMPLPDPNAGAIGRDQLPSLQQERERHSDLQPNEEEQLAAELKDSSWRSVAMAREMPLQEPETAAPLPEPLASGAGAGAGAGETSAARFDAMYEVGPILGKGTYGSVRVAKHRETGRSCAVKIIDKTATDSSLEDLAREIAMLADLKHPNIIRLVAAYESHSHVYVVTELASGGELMHRITAEGSVYSEREVRRHVFTILGAIDFMHSKGIVHRDLKPENILLSDRTEAAEIKIVDFGLSQYTRTDKPTLLQTICGTHKYLSPEMILCDRGRLKGYSKAVDMWGVGIILYVMLFGFNPFEGRTRNETHENILRCKYGFPPDANASQQVKDLISHLLTKDYARRYTVKECLAHPWLNELTCEGSPDALVAQRKSVRERLAEFNAQRSSVYEKVKSVHRRLSGGMAGGTRARRTSAA